MKKFTLFFFIVAGSLVVRAQQYDWTKNNGAGGLVGASVSMSPTLNSVTRGGVAQNETWVVSSGVNSARVYGAGNGVGPDIGAHENATSYLMERYDANMNLVWYTNNIASTKGCYVAADPQANDQFYIVYYTSGTNGTFGGFPYTGQPQYNTIILAKCKATGTNGFTALWIRKIDGAASESTTNLRVKDIGGGHTRIVVQGFSSSPSVSMYTDGTTGQAQTVPLNGSLNDQFLACFDDDGSAGGATPVWINSFGAASANETNLNPIEITDNGDVVWVIPYSRNLSGPLNYIFNNSSGVSPGAVTTNSYTANIGSSRYMMFSLAGSTGIPNWTKNELINGACDFYPYGVTSDATGNIYLCGNLLSTYTPAAGITITTAGGNDIGAVVFSNTGTALRGQRYGNAGVQQFAGFGPNVVALDRTNNRLYIAGNNNSTFIQGAATAQAISGYDGLLLAVDATGSMGALSAVSCNGDVANASEYFGGVVIRPDGNVIATQSYSMSAVNRLNGNSTGLLPKTSFGYTDAAVTKFDGNAASLLNPMAEGGWGGTTTNAIYNSDLKGSELLTAGFINGSMTVGNTTITNNGANASILTVTDTTTGTIKRTFTLLGNNIAYGMKVNPLDGSIYLCGGTATDLTPNGGSALGKSVLGSTGNDAYIMKLDANYNILWTALIGGTDDDRSISLDVDPATGEVYVAGYFNSATLKLNAAGGTTWGSTVIANNTYTGSPSTSDIFVAKFDPSGVMKWISTGGTPSGETVNIHGLKLMNGNLYFGCSSAGTFNFGTQAQILSGGSSDLVLMQLNTSTGSAGWIKSWMGNGADVITGLTTDNNLIYVSGYSISSSGITLGGKPFISSGSNDAFVFAVDANGVEQPGLVQLKGNGDDQIWEVKPDGLGNLFFAGSSTSSSLPVAGANFSSSGGNDCLTGVIDEASMTPKWAFLNGSVNTDYLRTISPGKPGMAFVGGALSGTATFGNNVLKGRMGGDFVYGRISYPYIAPGAQLSTLNAWYKANNQLSGSPATQWTNSTVNSSLTNLTNTGGVPVNSAGLNFNPTFTITGGSSYLSQSNVYAPNITDASGTHYTIYAVAKPSTTTDKLAVWGENTTSTGVSLGAASNIVTGTGGVVKTATNTVPMATDKYSISTLLVNGGTMTNYLNGTANGTQSGVAELNTTSAGIFQVNGTGTMDIAEVIVYGTPHTTNFPAINKVETYLALKYGITLSHNYYSTIGDTLFKVNNGYANNIAGIAIDSAEVLIQKQGQAHDVASKGNMLTIGMGTITADNISNTANATQDDSYLVWGDNGGSVTTTQTTNLANIVSSCANRLPRAWKIQRVNRGIGSTQVKLDLNNTVSLAAYTASDIQLMIDKDGDGNFATGIIKLVTATSLTGNIATFDNVVWDADNSGSDVFSVIFNNKIPNPYPVAKNAAASTVLFTCKDVSGGNVFVDDMSVPTKKFVAINPNGNTGYNFTVIAVNNTPVVNNKMITNGTTQTSAFSNRMYIITDNGTNNYPSGMTVRVYYDPQDSIDAVKALDPVVTAGEIRYRWFKYPGTSVDNVTAAQNLTGITNATWLIPSAYGEEGGVNYVEFSGINSFSVFGSMAGRGVVKPLPLNLLSFDAGKQAGSTNTVLLSWTASEQVNTSSFVVERSSDGKNYTAIGSKPAAGNYAEQMTYTLTDANAQSGTNYYRLKMVDVDGQITYGKWIKTITFDGPATRNIYLSPNPTNGQFYVKGLTKASVVQIIDITGKVLQTYNDVNQHTMLNIASLRSGTYFVQVIEEGRIAGTFKLVKE